MRQLRFGSDRPSVGLNFNKSREGSSRFSTIIWSISRIVELKVRHIEITTLIACKIAVSIVHKIRSAAVISRKNLS
jgi:hypothetical protein